MSTTDYRGFCTIIKTHKENDITVEGICFKTEHFYGELHDTVDLYSYWMLITSVLFDGNEILPIVNWSRYMYGEISDALPSDKALYEAQGSYRIHSVPLDKFKITQTDFATCTKINTIGVLKFDCCNYQVETADGNNSYSYLKNLTINGKAYKEYKNRELADAIYVDYADELNSGNGESCRLQELIKHLQYHYDKKVDLV